jgi:LAGLIDADG-like domain
VGFRTAIDKNLIPELELAGLNEIRAYLAGALRDGTFNRMHGTWRIAQADRAWLAVIGYLVERLGRRSWVYREGSRNVWVLETRCGLEFDPVLRNPREKVAFVRGYFDAEGGIPRNSNARFYIQLTQKDRRDLERVKEILEDLGIACGRLHNPSARVDPDYWRFFVLSESRPAFVQVVGSWHPRKRRLLEAHLLVL